MELARQHLATWYQFAVPRRQDILGDFAGRELCAIHGESMLMYCLAEAKVDFQGGFQLLHAVHAVETFLSKLRGRGCNFHILWFDDHESLLVPGRGSGQADTTPEEQYAQATAFQKRRLTRAVLMHHLQRHSQETTPPTQICFRFPSIYSEEFVSYRRRRPVRLFFVSDGQAIFMCDNMGKTHASDETPAVQKSEGVMTFESIIYRLSTTGYTVGLLDDVEFQSSEVRATLFSATNGCPFDPACWQPAPLPETDLKLDASLSNEYQAARNKAAEDDGQDPLTSRELISAIALATLLKEDPSPEMQRRAAAFLVHLAILKHCALPDRPAEPYSCATVEAARLDSRFVNIYCEAATILLSIHGSEKDYDSAEAWDAYDLMDGRLWAAVLKRLDTAVLPTQVLARYKKLAALVLDASGVRIASHITALDPSNAPVTGSVNGASRTMSPSLGSLLPFHQPDFEPLLRGVAVAATTSDTNGQAGSDLVSGWKPKVLREYTHWHNTKKLTSLNGQAHVADARAEFILRRRNPRHMAEVVAYAASLTNAVGKVLKPETIVTAKSAPAKPAGRVLTDRLIEKNHAELQKISASWTIAHQNLKRERDTLSIYTAFVEYLKRLSPLERKLVGPDALLYVCSILGNLLTKEANPLKSIRPDITALIWVQLQDLQRMPLSDELKRTVEKLSRRLGFSVDLEVAPPTASLLSHKQPLLFKSATKVLLENLKSSRFSLPQKPTEFQLASCGPYMERGFDSQPDPRVSNFNPDAWQRDVLDAIDKRQSLFTVAPTSAGKTFISFYAMKQVLQESNDGVLVYVAPTKALSNQVAADIQARFSKSYPPQSLGKSIWAIKTRDYRINNPTGCQVLVTVPHMLQILLLSPSTSVDKSKNSWPSRIRWIIFDEVHSIGQSDGGVVWEQLLLMAPCPIIALSATVGNPHEFKHWLEGCERAKGRELRMIIHSARYSDLRCYFWSPTTNFEFEGFDTTSRWPIPGLEADGYNEDSPFTFLHPVASLMDRSRDTLDDINLESRDCLALWQSMNKHQTAQYPLDPTLDPNVFFPATVVKADVVKWEVKLKKVLLAWLHSHDSPFLAVQKDLAPSMKPDTAIQRYGTKRTLELLVDLQKRGALPALIFLYDRSGCMESVKHIVSQLEAFEEDWKENSPEWEKTMEDFEKHRRAQEKAQKKLAKPPKKAKRRGRNKDDDDDDDEGGRPSRLEAMRDTASQEHSKWDSFDPDAPLERFSLANHAKLPQSELEEYIRKLKFAKLPDYIIEGLRRGVAVHHAGMNRQYRQTVEMLFRKGYLTAVVATGTLALGINMPCKTVVFSGDSTYLNALNYRQGAGRAGRRGFDILGNVVFYDFTPQRVRELMSSRLSDLRGHFPVSTSLVLRTSTLLHLTDRCEFAQQCVKSLFSQTRIYLGGPEGEEAIKHHLRFSIEYLRRHHLLSAEGVPLNFSGLVGHLYYTENAVFAFHSLLQDGYFHKLCAGLYRDEAGVLNTLMLVLAHIFQRHPCRRYKDEDWLKTTVRPSSSVVLLPPLPREAESILRAHNASTLSIFRAYVQSYIRQHLVGQPDDALPFTNQRIAPTAPLNCISRLVGEGTGGASHRPPPVELRSPFAALSGFGDEFRSIRELCSTVRAGVFLEESSVPYIAIYPLDTDGVPFNAYIYDFFRHGDLNSIIKGNGVKDGDAWYLLQDFSLILATIVTSLMNFIDPSATADDDLTAGGVGEESDHSEDDADYNPEIDGVAGAGLDRPVGTGKNGNAAGGPPADATALRENPRADKTKKKKKKQVLDSWEDGSDSDSDVDSDDDAGQTPSHSPSPPPSMSEYGSTGTGTGTAATSVPSWSTHSEESLKMVLAAFTRLKEQFDEKFRKVWS